MHHLSTLLSLLEHKLGWGKPSSWSGKDFERLSEQILDSTGVSLSSSTLRRLWGRTGYDHLPSATTLDTLAQFAGFISFRDFEKQLSLPLPAASSSVTTAVWLRRSPKWVVITVCLVAVLIIAVSALQEKHSTVHPGNYSFSSRPLTRDLPNSVVFTYDATAAKDSVFIQQSWDPRTKTCVDASGHTFTSLYYEPGFFQAKLMVGNAVVKEHPLLIPTTGWRALIKASTGSVLYLDEADFLHRDSLSVPAAVVRQKTVGDDPPVTSFFNVGNFTPQPIATVDFRAQVRNEWRQGNGRCRFAHVVLITDNAPVIISLSALGCVSDLSQRCVNVVVSGRTTDLSAFGVPADAWTSVGCKAVGRNLQLLINGKLALTCALPEHPVKVVGVQFAFQGCGSVQRVQLNGRQLELLPGS